MAGISSLPALFAGVTSATAVLQGRIAEEVNGGTLEQSQLSPAQPTVLVLGRVAALAVEGLIPAAVPALALGLGYRPHWVIQPDALVPLILTILDALGYGLLMTALTLRLASIGAVVHVFNMAIMFFGGMFIPITLFPHGIESFARFVPTALGAEVLNTTLSGRGLGAAWSDGTLPCLLTPPPTWPSASPSSARSNGSPRRAARSAPTDTTKGGTHHDATHLHQRRP